MRAIFGAGLVLATLGGCGGGTPEPSLVDVAVTAEAGANAGPDGTGRPVSVSLLRLRDVGTFNRLDYFTLQNGGGLGADVAGSEQLSVAPGQTARRLLTFEPGPAYLGVIAAYRDIDGVRWREAAPIPAEEELEAVVTVGADGVSIAFPED